MGRRRKVNESIAIGYVRASTPGQKNTPEAQRQHIEDWARREGVEVVSWHSDLGVSVTKALAKRSGLLDAVEALKQQRASVLVVASRDRFMRDALQMGLLEHTVARLGAKVVTVDGVGSLSTPEAKLINTIIDAVAEYEAALTGARTRRILEHRRRARRRFSGVAPYGYAYEAGKLVESPREERVVQEMLRLRRCGFTYSMVAEELTRTGERPRGDRWPPSMVCRIIKCYETERAGAC